MSLTIPSNAGRALPVQPGMRLRVATLLVRPTLRLVPWPVLASGAVLGAVMASALWLPLPAVMPADRLSQVTDLVRMAGVAVALGVVSTLDDPTEAMLASTPASVLLRRCVRILLALPALALAWWAIVAIAATSPIATNARAFGDYIELDTLTHEAAIWVLVGLALAAAVRRVNRRRPAGAVVAPLVLLALLVAWALPRGWSLFTPVPSHDASAATRAAWATAQYHFNELGVAAIVVLVVASADIWRRARIATQPTT